MNILKCIFLLLFGIINFSTVIAEDIFRLTTENGLSNYNAISMYQDERGYIWIGTRNGVNLYNGNSIKIFKNKKNNENSLIYNNVTGITGNKNGEVYFMTPNGISLYDIRKNKFKTITNKKSSAIFFHENLYYAIRNNIYKYSDSKSELIYELPNNYSNITSININNDKILIGTEDCGLFLLSNTQVIKNIIPDISVTSIMIDSNGTYWIGSIENGFYIIKNNKIENINISTCNDWIISSNYVRCFCEDKQGNIWIGTFKGLDYYDYSTNTFSNYIKEKGECSASIWCMLCDIQGSMWIGTYFNGVYKINTNNNIFYYYSSRILESLKYPLSCICEDNNNNLWIGTSGGGLNKFNVITKKTEWYFNKPGNNSLSHNNINTICYDSIRNVLWIGTNTGGLNKLDLNNNKIKVYKHNNNTNNSIISDIIKGIAINDGNLYLATQKGVCMFNPDTENFEKMFQIYPNKISYAGGIFIDKRKTLWIYGTSNGVYSYNLENHKFRLYKHDINEKNTICGNTINKVYEDKYGNIWFCSDINGVDKYIYETDTFINFDKERNGIISNSVCSVCQLSEDKLLFSTDAGISIFDLKNEKFTNFDEKTGLPKAAFNAYYLHKDIKDNIIIGSANGMISFKENNINKIPKKYSILPYRLFINGTEIEVNDETKILNEDLCYKSSITLNYNQSIIGIEYSVTNYIYLKNNLEYFLKGFSKEWTNMRGGNIINFTNLNPGKYTLMVRPTDNRSNIPTSSLNINILPPWYKTIWAYCIFCILILILTIYIIKNYRNRILLKESLKYEKKHSEDIEKLNQNKLYFFTNIAHEFRTPLTIIIGQMEILLQSKPFNSNIYNRIYSVYKNSLQLIDLINELLIFRKQEQGYLLLNIKKYNIVDFLYQNYISFQYYLPKSNVTLKFQKEDDDIELWFDIKQMQKVVNNLLSNAFKHTKDGDNINISVRKRVNEVIIEISDTGTEVNKNDINKIFNYFHQNEKDRKWILSNGEDLGLVLTKGIIDMHHGKIEVFSEIGVGTTFVIKLKTGNKHFTSEQLSQEEYKSDESFTKYIKEINLDEDCSINKEINNKENKFKILIVENNEELKNMLVDLFSTNYTVITASNGKEGWEKTKEGLPDIVLTNIAMPIMSGIELCKLIKHDITVCHIPVVLLTSQTNIKYQIEGLYIGADDYICKPFNTNVLLAKCNTLINNRILLKEKFNKNISISSQTFTTNSLDKAFIENTIQIIEENINKEDFGVDILANKMGVARTKLYQKIKNITGKTPHEFILNIRMKNAITLLQNNPEFNITEIADKVGFTSTRQFSKHFKEKYKTTPQEFRKK